MRWIFLTLLLLNALLVAIEWSSRERERVAQGNYSVAAGVTRLALLKDASSDGVLQSSMPIDGVDQPQCLLLGPIPNKGVADDAVKLFDARGVRAKVVEQSIAKAPNYWVYLEPLESRRAAVSKLKKLKANKVDSYLITQGELANGISLGVFENIDSARRMLKRRKNQGYPVKLTELGKVKYEYWVAVMDEYSRELDGNIEKAMESIAVSFEKRQIFCKSVASEKKLP